MVLKVVLMNQWQFLPKKDSEKALWDTIQVQVTCIKISFTHTKKKVNVI